MSLDIPVLLPNSSWDETQTTLTTQYATTQNLSKTLTLLYTQQLHNNVIPATTLAHIQKATQTPCEAPPYLWVQWNPERSNRGLCTTPHPNPKATIPYKGGIPCFCCLDVIEHQWPNERGLTLNIHNQTLCFLPNIAPIFNDHFTVVSTQHQPQIMDIPTAAHIAQQLPDYWVIQNGPDAGATNPWHYHLQTFQGDLPIEAATVATPDTSGWHQVNHPATVFFHTFTCLDAAFTAQEKLTLFLAQNPAHRANILIKYSPHCWKLYLALRHTAYRTDVYKTGQPGYAEIGGVISTITQESWEKWTTQGANLYTSMMSDIALPRSDLQFP